ncbi:MAG: insulinase family protein [Chitinophagales bacterium]|nr:insulinase family protein [Chitinophagales bacterium]MCB9022252.1 insulinase family protein [Chitinophagales bacterium]
MINYNKFTLDNGLTVLVNEDFGTQIAAVDVLYKVGARNETADKTGFAHLFEHLMFGGSVNAPDFDTELQLAGGTNNAFTTNDLTNYYDVLPVNNIETALWLESDRMLHLDFSERSLDVQRNVVCEEFKEHYINRPYGDVWHKLREMVYTTHPYRWPTIGLELDHIREAKLSDVESFFYSWYRPNNAILSISGGISTAKALELAEKWFGDIPAGVQPERIIPQEPAQSAARFKKVEADVPVNLVYQVWHMDGRNGSGYYAQNLLSDVLGNGESSRLYQSLKMEQQLFTDISAYVSGSMDTGMFVVSGKLADGVSYEEGNAAITRELKKLQSEGCGDRELQRVKNMVETDLAGSYMNALNKAQGLAMAEMLGNADLVNTEIDMYTAVTATDMDAAASLLFREDQCSTMFYGK